MKNYSRIYEHLGDELSKEIFGYRVMHSETGDPYWSRKLLLTFPEGVELLERLNQKDVRKVIFGAGDFGKEIVRDFPAAWECFVDNNRHGTEYCGLPVISFDDYLKSYQNADIFVASGLWHQEMTAQLRNAGIDKKRIIDLAEYYTILEQRQYFDLPELFHDENEVFVDCGCLDGKTSRNFTEWCNNQYQHIYAFEPEEDKVIQCKAALDHVKSDIYNLGVWKEKGKLHFAGNMQGASHISENGELVIEVDSLDNVLNGKKVSFIKMDIEGAEMEALRGSEKLIRENTPKLAIAIYHLPSDIYEIPQLLLEYNPGYVFYLRHYSLTPCDTVLYAVDNRKTAD